MKEYTSTYHNTARSFFFKRIEDLQEVDSDIERIQAIVDLEFLRMIETFDESDFESLKDASNCISFIAQSLNVHLADNWSTKISDKDFRNFIKLRESELLKVLDSKQKEPRIPFRRVLKTIHMKK